MSCGLERFNDGAVMKEEDLLRGYYQFHVKHNNIFIPSTCYIDCIYRLQYSSLCKINGVLTLGNVPRSGDFDMPLSNPLYFSTQPAHGAGSGDVVDRYFTHKFLYYYRILNILLSNSQMYFRNIPIDYHDL